MFHIVALLLVETLLVVGAIAFVPVFVVTWSRHGTERVTALWHSIEAATTWTLAITAAVIVARLLWAFGSG